MSALQTENVKLQGQLSSKQTEWNDVHRKIEDDDNKEKEKHEKLRQELEQQRIKYVPFKFKLTVHVLLLISLLC